MRPRVPADRRGTDVIADRPRDLIVAGHVNVDRRLALEEFPAPDRTVPAAAAPPELGGTATNLGRVAAANGLRVGLFARVGDGFPAEFLDRIDRAGIDLRGVTTVRGRATPTCFILEDRHGGQRTLIDQGAMADDGTAAPIPAAWLREYAWVHIGTGPPAIQLRLAERARAAGVRVAADPAQEIFYRWSPTTFRRLLSRSELLFGNRDEIARAVELVGGRSAADLLELVPAVVRTEGRRGATFLTRAGRVHAAPPSPRRARSYVGAGDAFRGGFYAAFLRGEAAPATLRAGHRAAAAWIAGRRP